MRKLGVDLDGVLANFTDAYAKLATERTGIQFPKMSADWPRSWYWDRDAGVSKEDEKAIWQEITEGNTFWYRLEPLPGAHDTIRCLEKLVRQGHDVYFITNRMGRQAKTQTEQWLYNLGMNYPTVLVASDKLPIIKSLGIDFYIDDKPETVHEIAEANLDQMIAGGHPVVGKLYMKDMAYNRQYTELPFFRVNSLEEALKMEGLWAL